MGTSHKHRRVAANVSQRRRGVSTTGTGLLLLAVGYGCCTCSNWPVVHSVTLASSQAVALATLQLLWRPLFDSWINAVDCNYAYGLTCDSDGFVTSMNVSHTFATGTIPTTLADLSRLTYLNLDYNTLSGELPAALSGLVDLQYMSMFSNLISGGLPTWMSSLRALTYLNLGKNKLSGSLPGSFKSLVELKCLSLTSNNLTGELPTWLGNLQRVTYLDLEGNSFGGTIPSTLVTMQNLTSLSLRNNSLGGEIPPSLGGIPALENLQLGGNLLSGYVPTSLSALTNLRVMSVGNNSLTGSIPNGFSRLTHLTSLDMGSNKLSGVIPSTLSNLSQLRSLDLANNNLTGAIPPTMGALTTLSLLWLDGNMLSGSFPTAFIRLNSLFDLRADKSIECPVPTNSCLSEPPSGSWSSFCQSWCNPFCSVCYGVAPNTTEPDQPGQAPGTSSSSSSSSGAVIGIVAAVVVVVVVLSVVAWMYWRRRTHASDLEKGLRGQDSRKPGLSPLDPGTRDWQAQLFRPMTLSELRRATKNFSESRLVGRGGFGEVYLGAGPGGQQWAVKRSIKSGSRVDDAFKQEVLKLSRLSNPHLVSLLGYCVQKKERIVVYEFVTNGSLRSAIHSPTAVPLSLTQRVTVACGIAHGLKYLHHQKPPIVHRDIKPDNILLDEQWRAKLADFGLLRALEGNQTVYTRGAGTPGYIDPEYWTSFRLTTASDVFSFGVVLLEMFTGRNAVVEGEEDLEISAGGGRLGSLGGSVGLSDANPAGIIGSLTMSDIDASIASDVPLVQPTSSRASLDVTSGSVSTNSSSTATSRTASATAATDRSLSVTQQRDRHCSGGESVDRSASNVGQQCAMPIRAWVLCVREKYGGGVRSPTWLDMVLDPKLQLEHLPSQIMEQLLQIGIDCSAWEPSSRPDIGSVERELLALVPQI